MHEEPRIHFDTHMADLEVHEEVQTSKYIIQEKEAEIRELKDHFSKANFMITFLQQENKQLQVKKIFHNKPKSDLEKDDAKGKAIVDVYNLEDQEE